MPHFPFFCDVHTCVCVCEIENLREKIVLFPVSKYSHVHFPTAINNLTKLIYLTVFFCENTKERCCF